MEEIKRFLNKYIWFLIIIFSIPAVWALSVPGYFGASDDMHIAWLYELHKTLTLGQIPPRFVPDLSFGFGYPLFNFAFPLPFYIAEIFHLLGLNLVDSIKTLFLITVPISGIFMYAFLKEFTSKSLSFLGAVLYIYTPYRAVDLYIRGAIGEIVGFMILPVVALSVVKVSKVTDKSVYPWIGIGALSLSALILTHNITAYMFLPFILLLWILRILFLVNNKRKGFILLFITAFLGLLTSGYFWIPALMDSSLMKYDTIFNFYDHFPTVLQLITPYWGYGASVPGPYDGMPFFLGISNVGLLPIALLYMIFSFSRISKDQKVLLIWAFFCIFSAIVLMNHRSFFIWDRLPLLPYFQFPWRFLTLTTFAIPILVITLGVFKKSKLPVFIIVVLILVTSGSYFRPQDFLGRKDDYYLNRYIPVPKASEEYYKTQEEYLRLPKVTKIRPDKNYPIAFAQSGKIENIIKINDLNSKVYVNSTDGMKLYYSKYYFPGWVAKIDGKEVGMTPGEPFGQISVTIPSGKHQVSIFFEETNPKRFLDAISLGSFLVSLGLIKYLWRRSEHIGRLS